MVASEIASIKKANEAVKTIVLPSNARDLMVEIDLNSSGNWKLQHSFDGVTWFDKVANTGTDGLVDIDGSVLQYVKVVFDTPDAAQTAKLYFGRSK
tara:strand:+ start:1784 stop:2071 length:288 start_codon:yes stop_codon:yes gene_type:complete